MLFFIIIGAIAADLFNRLKSSGGWESSGPAINEPDPVPSSVMI